MLPNTHLISRSRRFVGREQDSIPSPFGRFLGLLSLGLCLVIGRPATAQTFTLEEATTAEMQRAMNDGALTSVDLVSMYLNRIAVYDQAGVKLNAVPVVNPLVFAEAQAADAARAAGAEGPLLGVPYVVKDSYKIEGMAIAVGVKDWLDIIASEDAKVVTRIRQENSPILGRANMATLALSADNSISDAYGAVLNPYEFSTPGGSSGGSAVAVAANLSGYSLGGETWGSIRVPSSLNGIAGHHPTRGLVPLGGTFPLFAIADVLGPFARTVADVAAVMDTIAFRDDNDLWTPYVLPFEQRRPVSYSALLRPGALAGKRIAVPKPGQYVFPDYGDPATFSTALDTLRSLGATVVEVEVPIFNKYADPADADIAVAYAWFNAPTSFLSSVGAYWVPFMLAENQSVERLNALSLAIPVPPEALGPLKNSFAEGTSLPIESPLMQASLAANNSMLATWTKFLDDNNFDAVAYVNRDVGPAFRLVDDLGLPAVSVPMSIPDSTGPVGLLFTGRAFDDGNLLALANDYELGSRLRRPPSLTPPLPGETIEYSTNSVPPVNRPELSPPALRIANGSKITGNGKSSFLLLSGSARDQSGLRSLKVYVNGRKIAAKVARNWKASVKVSSLRKLIKASARSVQVSVVAKDVYGNTSVRTGMVKLPKNF